MREIGVLDSTMTHDFSHFLALLWRKLRAIGFRIIVGRNDIQCLANGFIQQALQSNGLPGAGFKRSAILSQHRAKTNVDESSVRILPLLGHGKQLLEMFTLPMINHVENGIGLPGLHPILDRGQIGRGIEESTVSLANDHRRFKLIQENTGRSFTLPG